MTSFLCNIQNWRCATIDEMKLNSGNKHPVKSQNIYNFSFNKLKPIDLYCYLKARFDYPRGSSMAFKSPTRDNLVHWHYELICGKSYIDIVGYTSKAIFQIKTDLELIDNDFKELLDTIKKEFAENQNIISAVRKELEHWVLFVNPFRRLLTVVENLASEIKLLNEKPRKISDNFSSPQELNDIKFVYFGLYEKGLSLKILIPIFAESFINMLIFILLKDKDSFNDISRQHINKRIENLHNYSEAFVGSVNLSSPI
ncbi:MAG: hypothetical protein ACTHJ4_02190 [Candidatus Nucleicultricaceae bacterium]